MKNKKRTINFWDMWDLILFTLLIIGIAFIDVSENITNLMVVCATIIGVQIYVDKK